MYGAQIDKEGANVERVKQGLSEAGLLPEEWGGQTPMVPVSEFRPWQQSFDMPNLVDILGSACIVWTC